MADQEGQGGEKPKDEHGCIIGEETWDSELEKCVPIEKPAEKAVDEVMAENAALRTKIRELQVTNVELTKQLGMANDVLEAQTKASLIEEIRPLSHFSVEDLHRKTLTELQNMRDVLKYAKLEVKTIRKNIRPGPGVDIEEDPRMTVGDISVVTAAKRKMEAQLA